MYKDKEITYVQQITHRAYFCSKCDKKLDEATSYEDGYIPSSKYHRRVAIYLPDELSWYHWEEELCDECYAGRMKELKDILTKFGFKKDKER